MAEPVDAASGGATEQEIAVNQEWLEQVVEPKIRQGVAQNVGACKPSLDYDEQQDAVQNALIKVWRSPTARTLRQEDPDRLRAFAYQSGHNAAIDQCRQRWLTAVDGAEPIGAAPGGTDVVDRRDEVQHEILRLRAVMKELTNDSKHPHATVLGMFLHLTQNEEVGTTAESVQGGSYWQATIEALIGDPTDLPAERERRYDIQIAAIMRPDLTSGAQATDLTRRQAAQWVRTELSHARRELRDRFVKRYGVAPLQV